MRGGVPFLDLPQLAINLLNSEVPGMRMAYFVEGSSGFFSTNCLVAVVSKRRVVVSMSQPSKGRRDQYGAITRCARGQTCTGTIFLGEFRCEHSRAGRCKGLAKITYNVDNVDSRGIR